MPHSFAEIAGKILDDSSLDQDIISILSAPKNASYLELKMKDRCGEEQDSLLHLAIKMRRIKLSRFIIDHVPDYLSERLNVINAWGETPLHYAIEQLLPELADNLVNKGADPYTSSSEISLLTSFLIPAVENYKNIPDAVRSTFRWIIENIKYTVIDYHQFKESLGCVTNLNGELTRDLQQIFDEAQAKTTLNKKLHALCLNPQEESILTILQKQIESQRQEIIGLRELVTSQTKAIQQLQLRIEKLESPTSETLKRESTPAASSPRFGFSGNP